LTRWTCTDEEFRDFEYVCQDGYLKDTPEVRAIVAMYLWQKKRCVAHDPVFKNIAAILNLFVREPFPDTHRDEYNRLVKLASVAREDVNTARFRLAEASRALNEAEAKAEQASIRADEWHRSYLAE
jgi:hypothetical protein